MRQKILVTGVAFVALTFYFYALPLTYVDFINIFHPVGRDWLSPYEGRDNFFNPPWLAVLLAPFSVLPARWGASAWLAVGVLTIGWYLKEPEKIVWMATSPGFLVMLTIGQIDWVVLWGVIVPQLSLVLFILKPQAVIFLSLNYLNRQSVGLFVVVVCLSLAVWGWWPADLPHRSPNQDVNIALFPFLVPLGLYLLWRKRDDAYLAIASLCLAPYFMPQSILPAYVIYLRQTDSRKVMVAGWLVSWSYYLLMRLT